MLTITESGARASRLILVASALFAPAAASAEQINTTLTVEADVVANCTVSAGSIDFPDVNPLSGSNVNGSGTFSITCTNGTGWTAAADIGAGSGASFATRRMTSSGTTLNYNLYTSGSYGTVWGDGSASTAMLSGTGTGTAQSTTVYGRVPSGQTTAPPGAYADSVSITITY